MDPDLRTRYLGLELANPLVAAASPVTGTLESLRRVERAGAAAVVLPSLFEEQIEHEAFVLHQLSHKTSLEQTDYFPALDDYNTGPASYLRLIEETKRALSIPVIASLNGSSHGGWTRYAQDIEAAGADALELNVYFVPVDPDETGGEVELQYLGLVSAVREVVTIPLAVKVGPGFSAPANMARKLIGAGADGLVLFNRFLRPDIDLDECALVPSLVPSRSQDLRIPLQWIGILRDSTSVSLAASSGVHSAEDALKLLLVGADVTMVATSLIQHGPDHLGVILEGVRVWLEEHDHPSVGRIRGTMSRANCPDPTAYDRGNYMKTLLADLAV